MPSRCRKKVLLTLKVDFDEGLVSEQICLLWNGSCLTLAGGKRVRQELSMDVSNDAFSRI